LNLEGPSPTDYAISIDGGRERAADQRHGTPVAGENQRQRLADLREPHIAVLPQAQAPRAVCLHSGKRDVHRVFELTQRRWIDSGPARPPPRDEPAKPALHRHTRRDHDRQEPVIDHEPAIEAGAVGGIQLACEGAAQTALRRRRDTGVPNLVHEQGHVVVRDVAGQRVEQLYPRIAQAIRFQLERRAGNMGRCHVRSVVEQHDIRSYVPGVGKKVLA